jgi:hypothetical protein
MKVRGMTPADADMQKEEMLQALANLQTMMEKATAPKMIVRDAAGRAIGIQTVQPE